MKKWKKSIEWRDGHRRHDASTTGRVHLRLIKNTLINMYP